MWMEAIQSCCRNPGEIRAENVAELPLPDRDSGNADQLTFSPNGNRTAVVAPGADAGPRGKGIPGGTVRVRKPADPGEPRAMAALTGHAGGATVTSFRAASATRVSGRPSWSVTFQATACGKRLPSSRARGPRR